MIVRNPGQGDIGLVLRFVRPLHDDLGDAPSFESPVFRNASDFPESRLRKRGL